MLYKASLCWARIPVVRPRGEVKGVVYRNYHIVGVAHLNDRTGFWVPTARVRWRDAGKDHTFTLDGPQNRFTTQDAAEDHAIAMGKDWIDKRHPIP